ncbi:nuclear-pore anchor-like isoform X2 [Aristolochia californica]|uniref:nuclear-pore anchor-like isoform X2 n=1 Tax=Aristolochia californica TaxID=171875 RepID=UPI0035D5DB63
MPLFLSEEEFSRYSGDVSLIAEKADLYIRDLFIQLETAKAKSDASSITAEQTCSLLEQKYISLSSNFANLRSENLSLSSALEKCASELAEAHAEKHQTYLKAIEKDGELERLSVEVSELQKSKRQLLELLEQKDLEIGEKNSLIKTYLDKIVTLSEEITSKEAKLRDIEAESARCHAARARLCQEKELTERHNVWLNDELAVKVNSLIELRKSHTEFETDMSAKLADVERQFNECSSSLNWYKERVCELENKLASVQEELCLTKDTAVIYEERFSAEVATVSKLADLYKESAEEWSKKAGDLEGVIKALETHLSQVENDYREKLEKEVSMRKDLEKEALDLKAKLEKCEAEIENSRKANEMSLFPISSFESVSTTVGRRVGGNETDDKSEEENCLLLVPQVPAGISGTALAASLLRDGWSLAKMYEKYQEAADALRHERWALKHSEDVLKRVVHEIEEKAEIILDERAEHERMVEAYKLMDQKLQQSRSEHAKLESTIWELKADLRRHELDYDIAQKEIADLQKQVTVLLKECRDIQIRCGGTSVVGAEGCLISDALEIHGDSEMEKIISERLLTFKDINGLVEQNVQLRSLVRSLSDHRDQRDTELREKFEDELRKHNDEARQKVAAVLQKSEEQGHMMEALHSSVAMYKRLYEEELKKHSANSLSGVALPDGKKDLMLLFEGAHEVTKKAHEQAVERARNLEEELAKLRNEAISLRLGRDKLIMEANFAREQLERFMKESDHQRKETNGIRARNVEFSQLIVDYQKKLRDSADSRLASEELSRKLSMEMSVLIHEKDILATSEQRALDEVRNLTERVHRLQASLDTIQSAADVREEARAMERRKQEEYVKQIEREWAEAKKELQEERDRVRTLTHDKEQTLKDAMRQVEQLGKELADALCAVAAAEARAAAAEARYSNFEASIKSSERKVLPVSFCPPPPNLKIVDVNGRSDLSMYCTNEVIADLQKAKEELEMMKKEAQANKDHMLQYKEVAQVNEVALKQIKSAHENFKAEADRLKSSLEAEVVCLNKRVTELERDVVSKIAEASSTITEKEENLSSALSEINHLKEETSKKISQLMELEMQISSLREELEREHQRWRTAQDNYERQVILQSETIQELAKTSQALAALQGENSELRKLADARKKENDVLKATWETEKALLEKLKCEVEKKYEEVDKQNKILHSRLEALHTKLAEKERMSAGVSSASSDLDVQGGDELQTVICYLRRSKEIAETEVSLLKQEKLRLQSHLESALKAADTAQALLHAERSNSQKTLFTDEEFKSLKLQVNELNLLRESNIQLREENKHNFEECQKLREISQTVKAEADHLNSMLMEKETELDASRKEAEMLNLDRSNLENRISELLERTKGIDVEDYDRLKEDYQNMQLKLGEQQAEVEESKKLINQKEEMVVKLEEGLASSQSRLLEIEKRLNDTLQAEAVLKAEVEKHKRITSNIKKKADILAKEKEEVNKEKQTLLKQLEDMTNEKHVLFKQMEDVVKERQSLTKQIEDSRPSKKASVDTSSEQAMKEKDTRIQILERTLEREKTRRVKVEQIVLVKVTQVQKEREKVMEELEKHKLAKDSQQQTSGKLATELPVEIGLNEQATAYMSAVDDLEEAAQSALNDAAAASPVDTAAGLAGHQVQNLINKNPAAVAAAGSLQAKPIDEREKRALVPKPSTETRKTGRRLLRPQLERTQDPSNDVETPMMEGPTVIEGATTVEETKPGPSHEPEPYRDPTSLVHVPSERKRLASSTASEFREGTPEQESTDGEPVAKKTKGMAGPSEGAFMGEQSKVQSSEISEKSLPVEESGEATGDIMPASNEEIAEATKDGAMEEPTDMVEDVKDPLAGSHEGDLESESVLVVEEFLVEQPGQAEESPDGDPKGVDVPVPQHSIMEVESEKEEGEFVFEGAEQQEGGDSLSSLDDMEAGDSQVEPLMGDATAEMLPLEVVQSEKNVHGDATEEADEGGDKSSDDKPSNNNNSSVLESSQQSPLVSSGGGDGSSSSFVSESVSLKQSIPRSPVKEIEEKENPPVRRIVNLGERARENAAIRRAGVLNPSPGRGRGRAPTLVKPGGRGRGVRGGRGRG